MRYRTGVQVSSAADRQRNSVHVLSRSSEPAGIVQVPPRSGSSSGSPTPCDPSMDVLELVAGGRYVFAPVD